MERSTRRLVVVVVVLVVIAALAVAGGAWILSLRGYRSLRAGNDSYAAGNWAEAKRYYRWYLARQPEDLDVLRRYVEVCEKIQSNRRATLRDAAQAYQRIAVIGGGQREDLVRAAEFSRRFKLWEDLDTSAAYYLREHPEDAEFQFWKALAEEQLGNTNAALDRFRRLAESENCPPQAYGSIASLLARQGLVEMAEVQLNEAVEKDPSSILFRQQRARFYLDMSRPDSAEPDVRFVLSVEPDNEKALVALGQLELARRNWRRAAEAAEAALEKDLSEEAFFVLSNANARLGAMDKTVDRIASAPAPFLVDHPALYFLLADFQIELERFDDARATIALFRQAYPEDGAAFDYFEARELLKKGLAEDAARRFEILTQRAPQLQPARLHLAFAYMQSDRFDLAKSTLEAYLSAYPKDEEAIAIWNSFFGSAVSEAAAAKAAELLQDEYANPAAMVLYANALLRSAGSGGDDQVDALVKELLQKAYARDPESEAPFRALFNYHVSKHDLDSARTLLQRAQQEGIPEAAAAFAQASLALSEQKVQDAIGLLTRQLEHSDVTRKEVAEWAELFTRTTYGDMGLELLDRYAALASDDVSRAEREMDKVAYLLDLGEPEKALAVARELDSVVSGLPAAKQRLVAEKFRVADALVKRGGAERLALAEAAVEDVQREDPGNGLSRQLLARIYLARGREDWSKLEMADRLCASLRRQTPDEPVILVLSSEVARRMGQISRALDFALEAVKLAPSNASALLALAQAQVLFGQYNEAAATLNQFLALDSRNITALDLMIRALAGARRTAEAERALEQLESNLAASPEVDKAMSSLRLWLAVHREDWGAAEALARELYTADPTDYETMHLLVAALIGQGRKEEGEDLLLAAAESANTPRLWSELGSFYLSPRGGQNLARASAMFTRALVLNSNFTPAILGQIDIQQRGNNIGAAIGLCGRYLKQVPDDTSVLLEMAKLLAVIPGRAEEALAAVNQVIAKAPRPEALYLRGTILLQLERHEDAIKDLERLADIQGVTTAQVEMAITLAYLGLKNVELAKTHFETAKLRIASGDRLPDSARLDLLEAMIREAES